MITTASGQLYSEASVPFPKKLFKLMANEEGNGVIWVCDGFAFKITDQPAFVDKIIPKYFKHTKLTSFQRQLNLYGFRRLNKSEDQGAYFHPNFRRNRQDLVSEISRLPSKAVLLTLEEVMSGGKPLAIPRKKRILTSNFVTPIRSEPFSSSASTAISTKNDHFPTVPTAPIDTSNEQEDLELGPISCRTRHSMPAAAMVTPSGTNSFGLPLLKIPSYSFPGPSGSNLQPMLTAQVGLGFLDGAFTPRTCLLSPLFRPTEDFLDLCPDLIGSPYFSGLLGDSNLMACTPGKLSVLPSPMDRRASIRNLGSPILNPGNSNMHYGDSVAEYADHAPMATEVVGLIGPAVQVNGSIPFEPTADDQWLIGHSAEAFDKLLDMMYPDIDASIEDSMENDDMNTKEPSAVGTLENAEQSKAGEQYCCSQGGDFVANAEQSSDVEVQSNETSTEKSAELSTSEQDAGQESMHSGDSRSGTINAGFSESLAQLVPPMAADIVTTQCAVTDKQHTTDALSLELARGAVWDIPSVLHDPYKQVYHNHHVQEFPVLIKDANFLTSPTMLLSEGTDGRVNVRKTHFA